MEFRKEDEHLRNAVNDLPSYSPKEDAWEGIENILDSNQSSIVNKVPYRLVAAIIVILLISSFTIWNLRSTVKEEIQFSEEVSISEEFLPEDFLVDVAFDDFLESECAGLAEVCEDKELIQLLDQLEALRSEATDMVALINATGYDQYLMKAKSRLDRENAQLKREIIELIRG